MSERIWKHAWGTANYGLSHTSICEVHAACGERADHVGSGEEARTAKEREEPKAGRSDILGCEYIMFFGANPLEADFPMVGMARDLMQFKRNGGKICGGRSPLQQHRPPRPTSGCPITPGTDAALAMGMISWILENNLYDAGYLENTNQAACHHRR